MKEGLAATMSTPSNPNAQTTIGTHMKQPTTPKKRPSRIRQARRAG